MVSTDFDSLIAKVIVTASTWEDTVRKARRALDDAQISGVRTNLDILRAIVAHPDFLAGECETQWLESKQQDLLKLGQQISPPQPPVLGQGAGASASAPAVSSANTMFRKGDAWSLTVASPNDPQKSGQSSPPYHLELARVLRNEFPTSLTTEVFFTKPASSENLQPNTVPYTITLASTSASASAATSHHQRANPSDPSHIAIPFPGKLVEVLVDEGDVVKEGDVLCVVQQMKMELEVRSPRSGRVAWVTDAEDGEEVGEGTLAAIVESGKEARL